MRPVDIPSSDDALVVLGTALAGALTAVYLEWIDGNLPIGRDQLVDRAVVIVVSLLGTALGQ